MRRPQLTDDGPALQRLLTAEQVFYGGDSDRVNFGQSFFSFVNADVRAILPWYKAVGQETDNFVQLPGLNLLTISEHRDKYSVVSFGRTGIKGFTHGHRTTAGSLAFITAGQSPFYPILERYRLWSYYDTGGVIFVGPDQLPPFDLSITMVNEVGDAASIFVRGIEIIDSSRSIGVQDIQLTEVFSYIAVEASQFQLLVRASGGGKAQPAPGYGPLPGASNGAPPKVGHSGW
jgi:hypothetical protein